MMTMLKYDKSTLEVCMGMGIPIPIGFPWEMGVVLGY